MTPPGSLPRMIDPATLAVGCLVFVALVLTALVIYLLMAFEAERREHRAHVERLERMLASKNMGEFAATETVLTRAANPEPEKPPTLGAWEEMWSEPRRDAP